MLRITYCREGEAVSDFEWENWLDKIIETEDGEFEVSTAVAIHALSWAIAKGKLHHTNVVVLYKDMELRPDEYGHLDKWPEGFCSVIGDLIFERTYEVVRRRQAKENVPA